jgi:putative copper export protein
MVMLVAEVFDMLLRWTHIASAAVLVGGLVFARAVATPVLGQNPALLDQLARRARFLIYCAIAGLLVSGLFNLLSHPGHTRYYHMWFGVKFLLALHVFASAALAVRMAPATPQAAAQRLRRMTGAFISGLIIIFISAYLRRIY